MSTANLCNRLGVDLSEELVRHFLIDSTPKGVKLRGKKEEKDYGQLKLGSILS